MKFSGENVLLREIFHVVSRFMLNRGNVHYFLDSVTSNFVERFSILNDQIKKKFRITRVTTKRLTRDVTEWISVNDLGRGRYLNNWPNFGGAMAAPRPPSSCQTS